MKNFLEKLITGLVLLTPITVFAQDSISGLEFLGISSNASPGEMIAALYVYGVGFVALAAFIMFTIGGVMYIFSGDKDPGRAKEMMKNAFWGLVLALTSWLILYTINPDLVKTWDPKLQTIQTSSQTNPPITQRLISELKAMCTALSRFDCATQPDFCERRGVAAGGDCQIKQSIVTNAMSICQRTTVENCPNTPNCQLDGSGTRCIFQQ